MEQPLRDVTTVTRPEPPQASHRQRTQLAALVAGGLLLVCATVATRDWSSQAARARAAHNLRAHSAAKASIVKTYDSQGHVVRAADFPELPPDWHDLDDGGLDPDVDDFHDKDDDIVDIDTLAKKLRADPEYPPDVDCGPDVDDFHDRNDDGPTYQTFDTGDELYLTKWGSTVSFWHDIPLRDDEDSDAYNFVTEIPLGTNAKWEVYKSSIFNPIKQDTNEDGSLRYYAGGSTPGVAPDGNVWFNYGMFPQTWEGPELRSAEGYGGDKDPLDVIEIGSTPLARGSVTPVKVLGSLELIDEGENDSKVIVLRTSDPLAATVDALGDVDPGVTARLVGWLKNYDPADGVHEIGHGEAPYSVEDTVAFIDACHKSWKKLVKNGKQNERHYGYSLPKPWD